jgi:hypothetical protein
MADDLRGSRSPREEYDARLPGLGIGSNLVQEFEGLSLEGLVARGVPSEFDGVLNLCKHRGYQRERSERDATHRLLGIVEGLCRTYDLRRRTLTTRIGSRYSYLRFHLGINWFPAPMTSTDRRMTDVLFKCCYDGAVCGNALATCFGI